MDHVTLSRFVSLICWLAASSLAVAAAPADFERDIAPILVNHCLECHHAGKMSGQLNLTTAAGLLKGGESGPAIVAAKPAESYLIERVSAGEMPPPKEDEKRALSNEQVDSLRAWIAAGATWPKGRELGLHEQAVDLTEARKFWSYQPVQRPSVPQVKHRDRVANPIDAFVWQKLEAAGIEMAPRATQRDLLRRASLDVVGLPPTIAEQDRALADASPAAHAQLVDRLLANLGYGERWARHWLDIVRYADSNGYERDAGKPQIWRYRDYVIRSLNSDKPYDRFVVEQLAGDELPDATAETMIAAGFHALGTWQDAVDPLEAAQYRADELDDMIRTTSQAFLGVTLGCAGCHNHKFDPLTTVDYYSLSAILSPLTRVHDLRIDHDSPVGSRAELAAIAARDQKISQIRKQQGVVRAAAQGEWLSSGKSKLPPEAIAAFAVAADQRNEAQRKLVKKFEMPLGEEVTASLSEEHRREIEAGEKSIL